MTDTKIVPKPYRERGLQFFIRFAVAACFIAAVFDVVVAVTTDFQWAWLLAAWCLGWGVANLGYLRSSQSRVRWYVERGL